jgi:hypothetical protein
MDIKCTLKHWRGFRACCRLSCKILLTDFVSTGNVSSSQSQETIMQKYKKLDELVDAIKRGEITGNVVSPGAACAVLGITRQTLHDLLKRDKLPSWGAERVILIDADAVQARALRMRGVPEGQGDLYA